MGDRVFRIEHLSAKAGGVLEMHKFRLALPTAALLMASTAAQAHIGAGENGGGKVSHGSGGIVPL